MTPRQMRAIGQRLFGSDWQSPMARKLKVHRSTVWRWLTNKMPIPDGMADKIKNLDTLHKIQNTKFDTSKYVRLTPLSKLMEE